MKALVTGGCGFIGSHLSEYLFDKGYSVTVLDDLSTGRLENITKLEGRDGFRLIIGSILDKYLMEGMIGSVDVIFHLASAVGVRLILNEPVKTIQTIIEGTSIVLSEARKYGKKVLITSSSEVYGKGNGIPFSENDDTLLGPTKIGRWVYGAAKGIDEFLAFAHWYESKLPVICVRLFNTVGPRQTGQYGMVIPTFIQQSLKGEDITVYGDGEQTRSFCHVRDVVPALVDLMNCEDAVGKVVNIGSDEEVSINHLAERIKELTGSTSQIIYIPYEKAYTEGFEDMMRRVPNIDLAKKLIGFNPKYSLDETLKFILDRY